MITTRNHVCARAHTTRSSWAAASPEIAIAALAVLLPIGAVSNLGLLAATTAVIVAALSLTMGRRMAVEASGARERGGEDVTDDPDLVV